MVTGTAWPPEGRRLDQHLSNTPNWVDTVIPVDPYGPTTFSDQPGAAGSVQSIDTTFSRAQVMTVNGVQLLVATQTVTTPADDYTTDKVRWYEISITGTPTLVQQGTIDPGPGIATYNGQIAINADGASAACPTCSHRPIRVPSSRCTSPVRSPVRRWVPSLREPSCKPAASPSRRASGPGITAASRSTPPTI